MKNIILLILLGVSLKVQAQISKLEKLKGTWLITYADTAKNGAITKDSIITKLDWSADGNSLVGNQRIITAGKVNNGVVLYTFNESNGEFTYSENSGQSSPLIINGDLWIYPAGNYRTLNTFNKANTEIIYKVEKLIDGKWITTKKGQEVKIKQ